MAGDNKKTKCATTVSDKDGFKKFQLRGFPPNMSERQMRMSDAMEMSASNKRNMVGDGRVAGLRTPRIQRRD